MVCECKDTTSVGIDQMFCGFFFEKTLIFLLLGRNGVVWQARKAGARGILWCFLRCAEKRRV